MGDVAFAALSVRLPESTVKDDLLFRTREQRKLSAPAPTELCVTQTSCPANKMMLQHVNRDNTG